MGILSSIIKRTLMTLILLFNRINKMGSLEVFYVSLMDNLWSVTLWCAELEAIKGYAEFVLALDS